MSGLQEKEILTINWMFSITFICLSLHKLPKSRICQQRTWFNCFVPYVTVGWKISRNNTYKQKYGLLNQTILAVEHNLQVSLTPQQYFACVTLLEAICSLASANVVCRQTRQSVRQSTYISDKRNGRFYLQASSVIGQ